MMQFYKPRQLDFVAVESLDWMSIHVSSLTKLNITLRSDVDQTPLYSLHALCSFTYTPYRNETIPLDFTRMSCRESLKVLTLNCMVLVWIAPLQHFMRLQTLKIWPTHRTDIVFSPSHVQYLSGMTCLESLQMYKCVGNIDLGVLSVCTLLHSLDLSRSINVNLNGLRECTSLTYLNLSTCVGFTTMEPLSTLIRLTDLNVSESDIRSLDSCIPFISILTHLNIEHCVGITHLPIHATFDRLETLIANECTNLENIDAIDTAANTLLVLFVNMCDNLTHFPKGIRFTRLEQLNANACPMLFNIDFLHHCTQLTSLELGGSNNITDLQPLANLTQLKHLIIPMEQIVDFSIFDKLVHLRDKDNDTKLPETHNCHRHALTFTDQFPDNRCFRCRKSPIGDAYRCDSCDYDLCCICAHVTRIGRKFKHDIQL